MTMSAPLYPHEQWLVSQPAEVWDFERLTLNGIMLTHIRELPELRDAPREFTHGWLPSAVEAAVHRFADAVTTEENDKLACVRRFNWVNFISEGYVEQISTSARIWVGANGAR